MAGALAMLNPCAFPLLPAFLSFYVGADERQLPQASNRIAQGLLVGLLVAGGSLGVFTVVGLPIAYGVTLVADALPWAGMAIGLTLCTVGALGLAGKRIGLPAANPLRPRDDRRLQTILVFGAGYAVASLGCTLPVFLTLLAAAGAGGPAGLLAVFAAYGGGMALLLMALSVAAALLNRGLARGLGRVLPHMHRIAGGLLVVAGTYLTYFWARVHLGPSATLASDPLVGMVTRFTARLTVLARSAGPVVVLAAALVVAAALIVSYWQCRLAQGRTPRDR